MSGSYSVCFGCWKPLTVYDTVGLTGEKTYECEEHGRVSKSWVREVPA